LEIYLKVEDLVKNINKSFVEDLQRLHWMDKQTRSSAVEKARKMKFLVGYPKWYNTTSVNKIYREVKYITALYVKTILHASLPN